ncbi:alcohol dehydrogenase (NADP(+)) [Ranunculus cassubicifolius]
MCTMKETSPQTLPPNLLTKKTTHLRSTRIDTVVEKTLMSKLGDEKSRREDIFLTFKLWRCDRHDPVSALSKLTDPYTDDYG